MVDDRLVALLTWERETSWQDYELKSRLQHEFERELEYYLQYNLKPSDSLPQLEKMINMITVPSGKFKFYNYWLDGGGTMSCDKNFIQFIDDDGYEVRADSVYVDPIMYPDVSVIGRCAMMHDSGEQTDKMLEMWSRVKGDNLSPTMLIFIIVSFLALLVWGVWRKVDAYRKQQAMLKRRRHAQRKQQK
jgi:hypothetical protein